MQNKVTIYTDGGSRGNPGPAAIGVVIKDSRGKIFKEYSEYIDEATNNEAEYQAVVFALKKAKLLFGKKNTKEMEIEIKSDSELLVKQLNGEYKIKEENLIPLFIKIWNLKQDFGKMLFTLISREKNKEADKLVNKELNQKNSVLPL